uniref:CD81 molecule n=1 Tax=Coturnix japonica TaxID=93934 RepID=A0A8C2YFT8_COTJA
MDGERSKASTLGLRSGAAAAEAAMGVEGCTKCIKYLLFVFNFIFWLAGGIILGVALWLRHDSQTTNILYLQLGDKQAPNTFYVGIYILIAVGAVMMFVGFLGCYGAIQESQCLLGTFFTCLVILFACEVAAGIWGFVNKDQIAKDVKQFYDQAFQQALMADSDSSNGKAVVRTFHETLDCCGPDAVVGTLTPLWRDDLCSKDFLKGLLQADASCHKKIDELFSGKLYLIGIAAIVVAVIMLQEGEQSQQSKARMGEADGERGSQRDTGLCVLCSAHVAVMNVE